MSQQRVDELREQWHQAVERDRPADGIKALVALEKLQPGEPQWAQRLGEGYRRSGKMREAEEAFVRAMQGYAEKGFVPRAIAMAKLVSSLNPARTDLLKNVAPQGASLPRVGAPPPAPPPVRPVLLERAKDAREGEIRFDDVEGPSSIQVTLEDFLDEEVVHEEQGAASMPPSQRSSFDRLTSMAAFRLFTGLSREALASLSTAAELVEFIPGAMVIMKDEPAYALYAIVSGAARVIVSGGSDIRLGEGEVFGEACLLGEGQRQADVRAETPLMTLRIEKSALDEVTKTYAEIGDALFQLLARRLVTNLIQTSPLFTAFEPHLRLELAQMFEVRRAEPQTILAERGRRSDGLYILLAGNVTATGKDGAVTRIARGSTFGHESLLEGLPSADTVCAVGESVVLRLAASRFSSLAAMYPPALAHLSETLGTPLRASHRPSE